MKPYKPLNLKGWEYHLVKPSKRNILMPIEMLSLHARIKALADIVSMDSIARACRVSPATLSRWITRKPHKRTLDKVIPYVERMEKALKEFR